jgi:hypothetical protein
VSSDVVRGELRSYFSFHGVAQVHQFHQDHIGLPEDGVPNAPKHVGAR